MPGAILKIFHNVYMQFINIKMYITKINFTAHTIIPNSGVFYSKGIVFDFKKCFFGLTVGDTKKFFLYLDLGEGVIVLEGEHYFCTGIFL